MTMNPTPNKNTDQALIDAYLAKGGKVTVGATKAMDSTLEISNINWNNKENKIARKAEEKAQKPSK